ncbi:3,4-dihydroxy-2-butanone-4-phosphate synthase [Colwellia sp. 1_MG-2023]|jgi:3,4-dihydroxy 2-butanone 4-phosphate synthase|uniref:3,4-dihydroxy-2-butanone-4-phosphate synthase n=1 Tax=unclassified Colwellia TaxID=196834 RepID=UPI001C0A0650|nr:MULTISPECIES: 3,4-dihydroxy-2-butanone-4-phosphate synthase [unclassified Colwellia]MBU2923736.1 3,4-dihydroxy-2-butanone-4-phosphate synthase [Colwellia sp. C2M11]MDO6652164.1 3,4-dihydroxy-2-butanone-4-phosphate synthase [Colwellia sp. 3_MG-2023]MDO6664667.1 3,4-dihydroxy-2-butanone-4-phosphate synthase [Colwellia sp. 2_MG-2023]MDO6689018.1 3,4-dihydroxy-2-butanone-4-phosphate synthase [Colwellia sp. 1_MG-2023]
MSQSLLSQFGTSHERVESAISALQSGKGLLLVDDEDRENEGDLIFSTQHLTQQQMAMMIRECSGIVCLVLEQDDVKRLKLPQMVLNNTSRNKTAYTVSIEAKQGVTTGVSAADRVRTIQTAADPDSTADDLNTPGHVFPLLADSAGVLARRGHTEGTIDLIKLSGLHSKGVLCELTNEDGTMARLPEICQFALKHEMIVLSIEDIVNYRNVLLNMAS